MAWPWNLGLESFKVTENGAVRQTIIYDLLSVRLFYFFAFLFAFLLCLYLFCTSCTTLIIIITDIWTKFGTEHKYHTANTPEWPNSHKLKIQDGGGRHLRFRKNVNNSGLDKEMLHQIIWEDASPTCGDDHATKSRNRKLIRGTSSNENLKHMCVDLSDCNR